VIEEICYKRSAYVIMEAKDPIICGLQAGDSGELLVYFQLKLEGLRICLEKMDIPAPAEKPNSPFLYLVALFRPQEDCTIPTFMPERAVLLHALH
jgi:hypothetical protein